MTCPCQRLMKTLGKGTEHNSEKWWKEETDNRGRMGGIKGKEKNLLQEQVNKGRGIDDAMNKKTHVVNYTKTNKMPVQIFEYNRRE